MTVNPITPKEVPNAKLKLLPKEVIEIFNELITEKFDGYRAVIRQSEILTRIAAKLTCTKQHIMNNHWLDVEDIFREAGWKGKYNSPDYTESYDPYFEFSPK